MLKGAPSLPWGRAGPAFLRALLDKRWPHPVRKGDGARGAPHPTLALVWKVNMEPGSGLAPGSPEDG